MAAQEESDSTRHKECLRRDIFDSNDCGNIAGITGFNIFALIRLNLDQPADRSRLLVRGLKTVSPLDNLPE